MLLEVLRQDLKRVYHSFPKVREIVEVPSQAMQAHHPPKDTPKTKMIQEFPLMMINQATADITMVEEHHEGNSVVVPPSCRALWIISKM